MLSGEAARLLQSKDGLTFYQGIIIACIYFIVNVFVCFMSEMSVRLSYAFVLITVRY